MGPFFVGEFFAKSFRGSVFAVLNLFIMRIIPQIIVNNSAYALELLQI